MRLRKKKKQKDVRLNVGPKEAAVRISLGLGLPFLMIWLNTSFFIWTIVFVSGYLFMTGIILFCFVKYAWRHFIVHKPDPKVEDKDFPVKKL